MPSHLKHRRDFRKRMRLIDSGPIRQASEGEPDRELQCSRGIFRARVQVVAVLKPNRPDEGATSQANTHREQSSVPRVMLDPPRHTQVIRKKDHGPFGSQSLLQFDRAQREGFCTDDLPKLVAWRSFAFGETPN